MSLQLQLNKTFFVRQVLRHAKDIFTNLPVFGRLTYLELNEVNGEALLQLLHNCPILNTLVLLNVSLVTLSFGRRNLKYFFCVHGCLD
jgi:hypothetical protein